MTSSMTGFSCTEVQEGWGSLVWEVRSVNHRYLEPHFRLPEQVRDIEPAIRETIKKNLKRGKVECRLKLQMAESEQSITLNPTMLDKLADALVQIETVFPDSTGINPMDIMSWPGVQVTEETNLEPVKNSALSAFKAAVEQLTAMRRREGIELERFILVRMDNISEQVSALRSVLPTILQTQRERLLSRLDDVKQSLDADRLEQEMVILAQKLDVEEELDRLDTHIREVKRTFSGSSHAVGRRLDFLMQELNREANTLSSKSIDAGLTQTAVSIKVLIEQAREQVQNIQ
ncbi:YicC/YloC family endoribonuclease [Candidatus Sororendozoicomonas aggregata]|uniref:YicC/YloC family endoribonuclease n=1 Tax=Candidatus Sororendozoicomonas aggregata TaxID=3073239 RepID=UPI002ED4E839